MNEGIRERLIDTLKEFGADLVGFGSAARFEGTCAGKLLPGVKTVVAVGFRVLRGSHRGVEEGATFYQYGSTGVETIEETVMPMALLRGCAALEDAGYLALPQKRCQTVMAEADGTNPEVAFEEIYRGREWEAQLDFTDAAQRCGLGEIGLHGALLTEEYGPLLRVGLILTDADIEPTPLAARRLCDNCGACAKACPGRAIEPDGSVDAWQCAAYYKGASRRNNPFMPPDAYHGMPERKAIMAGEKRLTSDEARRVMRETYFYPGFKHAYVGSICGRACDMACYAHLEEKGLIKKKFRGAYRKRKPFELG